MTATSGVAEVAPCHRKVHSAISASPGVGANPAITRASFFSPISILTHSVVFTGEDPIGIHRFAQELDFATCIYTWRGQQPHILNTHDQHNAAKTRIRRKGSKHDLAHKQPAPGKILQHRSHPPPTQRILRRRINNRLRRYPYPRTTRR